MSPTATLQQIVIGQRFNGPVDSANGGYASGVIAALVDGPAEVTLRRPVPLETPLDGERHDDGHVTLTGPDGVLIAEAEPALPLDLEPPVRPTLHEAREAMHRCGHDLPPLLNRCYVCSRLRADGLGAAFGALPAYPEMNAATVEPGRFVTPQDVWGALDCTSYTPAVWDKAHPSLLGRMVAEQIAPVDPERPHVVVGWPLLHDGRKQHSASAVLDEHGRTLAVARALWIRLR